MFLNVSLCNSFFSARKWWQFAINAKISQIQDNNRRLTKNYLVQRVEDIVTYVQIYTSQLKKEYIDITLKVSDHVSSDVRSIFKVCLELLLRKTLDIDCAPYEKHLYTTSVKWTCPAF